MLLIDKKNGMTWIQFTYKTLEDSFYGSENFAIL